MLKAVLFDLDDTLFDHKHSRLKGLTALQRKYPQLATVPLADLFSYSEHSAADIF